MVEHRSRQLADTIAPYASLGLQIALTMTLCIWGGTKADQWLGTEPWLLLLCSVLGVVLVMVRILHIARLSSSSHR